MDPGHHDVAAGTAPVIVVDNGSSDFSAEAAGHYPGVRVIAAGANLGALGRNLGVRQVTTPYVAFCDDDTWRAPGALAWAADLRDGCRWLASVTGRIWLSPAAPKTRSPRSCATRRYRRRRGCPGRPW